MFRLEEMLTVEDIALLEAVVAIPDDTLDYSYLEPEDES